MEHLRTKHRMHPIIKIINRILNQSLEETIRLMLRLRVQHQAIIDKVQQPINHKQPVVETELTIKMSNQAPPSNKSEDRPQQNLLQMHRILLELPEASK